MGKVWIIDNDGQVWHLPADRVVNTRLTPIPTQEIPLTPSTDTSTSLFVDHPVYGQFNIIFAVNGREGRCLSCGACCTHEMEDEPEKCDWIYNAEYNVHQCPQLEIDPRPNSLGREGRAWCKVRPVILDSGYKGCLVWPTSPYKFIPKSCGFRWSKK